MSVFCNTASQECSAKCDNGEYALCMKECSFQAPALPLSMLDQTIVANIHIQFCNRIVRSIFVAIQIAGIDSCCEECRVALVGSLESSATERQWRLRTSGRDEGDLEGICGDSLYQLWRNRHTIGDTTTDNCRSEGMIPNNQGPKSAEILIVDTLLVLACWNSQRRGRRALILSVSSI